MRRMSAVAIAVFQAKGPLWRGSPFVFLWLS